MSFGFNKTYGIKTIEFDTNINKTVLTIYETEPNRTKKTQTSRLGHLGLIPVEVVTSAIDILPATIGAIFTLASPNSDITEKVKGFLDSPQKMLSRVFLRVLNAVRLPAAVKKGAASQKPLISWVGDGLTTRYIKSFFVEIGEKCASSPSSIIKHVFSRLSYLVGGLLSIIARAFDLALGTPAALLALITLGNIQSLNNAAYRGLQVGGILNDIFFTLMNLRNPGKVKYDDNQHLLDKLNTFLDQVNKTAEANLQKKSLLSRGFGISTKSSFVSY